jgi:hypothetical protein
MSQIVKLRRSSVSGQKPTNANLQLGELALNTTDGKVYMAVSGSLGPSVEELISTNTVNTGSIYITDNVTASFFTGSFKGDGSQLTNISAAGVIGLNLSQIASGSATASISPTNGLVINTDTTVTGSMTISGSEYLTGRLSSSNMNVGIPTSNNWQTSLNGSYFNNFTADTNVSEILRFVAGLLSASAPDAAPNTKTYSTYTATAANTTTGTVTAGSVPLSSTNTTITYLQGKGFATTGSTIFNGITPIYTNSAYGYSYTSVAAGSTIVSSSVDTQLFGLGLLSSGVPSSFKVSGSFTFKFKDNSTKTDTATSSSQALITQTGAGTTSGVSLAKINTANSAVIPAAYQDGKFASVFTPALFNNGATAISGSGYYHISASISIASGSSAYTTPIASNVEVFYAPLTTISTNIPAQTPASANVATSSLTAVSRSLSGAPFLTSATYNISGSVTGLFNPLYYAGTGISTIGVSGTGLVATSGTNTVSTLGGTIQTSNAVYDSTGVTVRSTSTVPYETDIVKLNGLYTFTAPASSNVVSASGSTTPTTFTLTVNGLNKNGSSTVASTLTPVYHTAGSFGQPAASGSLAYYGRVQGTDTGTNSGASNLEPFTGESNRIQLADNILSFTGTAWDTTFGLYNLGARDLQVKPGYLVKPGGTYKYWLENPSSASNYKYYVRKFTTNAGVKGTITLNMGTTLVNWDSTTNNSVSALILFESTKSGLYTPPRFFDPSNALTNLGTITANTDGQNPFGSSIYVNRSNTSTLSSTTYTIPLISADGMILNATYTNIYVIVKYIGDPTPITSITTTFS